VPAGPIDDLPKTGLTTQHVGDLWLADIGIPRAAFERAGITFVDPSVSVRV
jgi:hypothetical protein